MHKKYQLFISSTLISLALLSPAKAFSAWFTATGQAVVINGEKENARKVATEEAIKQALLFAGASVRSVQQMTNGLLTDDHLEIRASGEVNTIQLINSKIRHLRLLPCLTIVVFIPLFVHPTS